MSSINPLSVLDELSSWAWSWLILFSTSSATPIIPFSNRFGRTQHVNIVFFFLLYRLLLYQRLQSPVIFYFYPLILFCVLLRRCRLFQLCLFSVRVLGHTWQPFCQCWRGTFIAVFVFHNIDHSTLSVLKDSVFGISCLLRLFLIFNCTVGGNNKYIYIA